MNGKPYAANLLGGLMEPLARCFTPQSAREILTIEADEPARLRITELAERSNEGSLSPDERVEYELFVEVGDLIALLQARAPLPRRASRHLMPPPLRQNE